MLYDVSFFFLIWIFPLVSWIHLAFLKDSIASCYDILVLATQDHGSNVQAEAFKIVFVGKDNIKDATLAIQQSPVTLTLVFMASNNPNQTWGFSEYIKIRNLCPDICKDHGQEQVAQVSESD